LSQTKIYNFGGKTMSHELHVPTILSNPFDPMLYSALPPVIPADQAFSKRTDSELFFKRVAELVCRFDLEAYVGVCLLHQHNPVAADELMVEALECLDDGRPALVMALTKTGEASEFVPVVWKLQEVSGQHRFIPLEHSRQAQAKAGYQRLLEEQLFLSEFSSLLLEFDYQDTIGLTVLRIKSLSREAGDQLVERTHAGRVANVVTAEQPTEDSLKNLIVTNWSFVKRMAGTAGKCEVGACEPTTTCSVFCDASAEHNQGHLEEAGHEAPHIETT
jgi:hypothetical protein